MKRGWQAFLVIGVMIAVGVVVAREGGQEQQWKKLATRREQTVWVRHLPSYEAFLTRQIGYGARLAIEPFILGGFKENYLPIRGILMDQQKNVGFFEARYFYQGWAVDPSSAEYSVTVAPEKVSSVFNPELAALANETFRAGDGKVNTLVSGPLSWTCLKAKDKVRLVLRTTYPTSQMEAIPDYDRGSTDWMEFDIKFKVLRFLQTQALSQGSTYYSYLPVYNPPSGTQSQGLGLSSGVARKDGKFTAVEMSISGVKRTFGYDRTVNVHLRPMSEGDGPFVFTPAFLAMQTGAWHEDQKVYFSKGGDREGSLRVSFPLGYPIENLKLTATSTTAAR